MSTFKFHPGRIVATPAALIALDAAGISAAVFLPAAPQR